MTRNFFVRAAGHDHNGVAVDGSEAGHSHALWGGVVITAAIVAALSWGVAFHSFANVDGAIAWSVAAIGAFLGATMVMSIDRLAIYQMDTQTGFFKKSVALILRIGLVCLISFTTTRALAPWILNSDLRAQSLKLREDADRVTAANLTALYRVPDHRAALEKLTADETAAREAVSVIPQPLLDEKAGARACWADYTRRKAVLINNRDYTEAEARSALAGRAATCDRRTKEAEAAIIAHRLAASRSLNEATVAREKSAATLDAANKRYADRLHETETVRASTLNSTSSQALDSLLEASVMAKVKLGVLALVLLGLELMPLLLKPTAERSISGARIIADRAIAIAGHEKRAARTLAEREEEDQLRQVMSAGLREALASPTIVDQAAAHFRKKLDAHMPIQAARKLIEEIEASAGEVASAMQRSPDSAAVIAEAWTAATKDVIESLRRGGNAQSPNPSYH